MNQENLRKFSFTIFSAFFNEINKIRILIQLFLMIDFKKEPLLIILRSNICF